MQIIEILCNIKDLIGGIERNLPQFKYTQHSAYYARVDPTPFVTAIEKISSFLTIFNYFYFIIVDNKYIFDAINYTALTIS